MSSRYHVKIGTHNKNNASNNTEQREHQESSNSPNTNTDNIATIPFSSTKESGKVNT